MSDRYIIRTTGQTGPTDAVTLAHIADTSDAHDASAISFAATGTIASTDVQAAIAEVSGDVTSHLADTTDAHAASAITNTPAGGITSTTVQAAVTELDTKKALRGETPSNGTIAIGDSTMANADTVTPSLSAGGSWFSRLCNLTGQQMRYVRNSATGGENSTQFLARLSTDVIAYSPGWCILGGPVNDRGAGISLATSKANYVAMVAALRAAGIRPILCTITPADGVSAQTQWCDQWNAWAHLWAAANSVHLLDVATAVVDSADGTWLSTYTDDGSHPNVAGCNQIATYLSTRLPPDMVYQEILCTGKGDVTNLVTNGVFVTDTNADGYADGVSLSAGSVTSKSLEARAPYGNWQVLTQATDALVLVDIACSSTGWSVGDKLGFAMEYSTSAAQLVSIAMKNNAGTVLGRAVNFTVNTGGATRVGYVECTIPSGTTSFRIEAGTNIAGTLKLGRATVRNLTTLLA